MSLMHQRNVNYTLLYILLYKYLSYFLHVRYKNISSTILYHKCAQTEEYISSSRSLDSYCICEHFKAVVCLTRCRAQTHTEACGVIRPRRNSPPGKYDIGHELRISFLIPRNSGSFSLAFREKIQRKSAVFYQIRKTSIII